MSGRSISRSGWNLTETEKGVDLKSCLMSDELDEADRVEDDVACVVVVVEGSAELMLMLLMLLMMMMTSLGCSSISRWYLSS